MSSLLYAIGRWAIRARILVLAAWIAILALLGAGAVFLGQGANGSISIPGTESQQALDTLGRTFGEVSGMSATIIVVGAEGDSVNEDPYKTLIEDATADLDDAEKVTAVMTPFTEPASGLADDESAAIMTIQIDGTNDSVPDATVASIKQATADIRAALPAGAEVSYGGDAFSISVPGVTPTEAIGVLVAFIVLVLTLGSLIAAGMPLLIALLGVAVSIAGVFFVTAFVELTSTTPMLALMLGLAVGIDYTLFIVSRHQEQLRAGVPLEESIARANATSGSAVVFAGLTVVIALLGLSVAGIPFLTALGVAAAAAVAIAVIIAITLTPAVLAMAGMRILPKKLRRALVDPATRKLAQDDGENGLAQDDRGNKLAQDDKGRSLAQDHAAGHHGSAAHGPSRADRFFRGWVRAVTKRPIITVVAVLVGLGIAAAPAAQLHLALPNATSLERDNPARVTYELTGKHFGEGFNGPLLLTGSIISSEDPLGLMDDLADEVRKVPGVADVPLATPNRSADTGIIQVIPEDGPHAESTSQLVHELREKHDEWEQKYGVSLAVTGFTAVGIDVSEMLFGALLPFSVLVVGLSLILLAMVFRSVWVPIKATLGYLLSVGVAFGAVVAVFQWGWLNDVLHVPSTGPVLSFMPIILMGVLFGLAMDYEVFLVSRIREEVVHGADAHTAIERGFVGSAKVVTAAAVIMFAVFAAFVPEGDPSIKVIALGLAVGVFVDAFIVRMTLVPAVLALLGDRAWRMPKWLDRILPAFDVEGEGLAREIAHENWPVDMPDARIASEGLTLTSGVTVPDVRVGPGEALLLDSDPERPETHTLRPEALAAVLSGRAPVVAGTLTVTGLLLPERASTLRRRAGWADADSLRAALSDRPDLLVLDLRDFTTLADGTVAHRDGANAQAEVASMHSALESREVLATRGEARPLTLVVMGEAEVAAAVVPAGVRCVRPGQLGGHTAQPELAHTSGQSMPAHETPNSAATARLFDTNGAE